MLKVSYNAWECVLSFLLAVLLTIKALFSAFSQDTNVLNKVMFVLVTTLVGLLFVASLLQQCTAEDGAGGRFQRSGLHKWWIGQRRQQQHRGDRERPHTELNERGLLCLADGLRESLIEDQIREQQQRSH